MEFLLILQQKRWSFDSVSCWNSSKRGQELQFGERLDSIPPENIIDNHSRFSLDLRKHTRNGHLGKVPGGFEPRTPGSPVQLSNH